MDAQCDSARHDGLPSRLEGAISLKEAAFQAGKSPETVARWCRSYSIGRQLHPHAPWKVDPVGLAIVMAGDRTALENYQSALKAAHQVSLAEGRAA